MQKSSKILEKTVEEVENVKEYRFEQVCNEFWAGNKILFFI